MMALGHIVALILPPLSSYYKSCPWPQRREPVVDYYCVSSLLTASYLAHRRIICSLFPSVHPPTGFPLTQHSRSCFTVKLSVPTFMAPSNMCNAHSSMAPSNTCNAPSSMAPSNTCNAPSSMAPSNTCNAPSSMAPSNTCNAPSSMAPSNTCNAP